MCTRQGPGSLQRRLPRGPEAARSHLHIHEPGSAHVGPRGLPATGHLSRTEAREGRDTRGHGPGSDVGAVGDRRPTLAVHQHFCDDTNPPNHI